MQEKIGISAIIPTYNREKTIGRAIDSALNQEYPPSEVIVVDDGSTDNTRKIIETYGGRIRYIHQVNAGVAAARNRGVDEAKYEWIAFLDSDDYWLPHHLKRMAEVIKVTGGRGTLYFSDIRQPSEEGGHLYWDLCKFRIKGDYEFREDAGDWSLMRIQPMMVQASLIRRVSYLEIGGEAVGLRLRGDTLIFFKLGLLYPACAVSGCGTLMSSDGKTRLTREIGSTSLPYWLDTISMYKELLAIGNTISRERRKVLTDSLSGSYYSIGRVFFRQKNYLSTIKNLAISSYISPSVFIKTFLGSLGRRVLKGEGRSLHLC